MESSPYKTVGNYLIYLLQRAISSYATMQVVAKIRRKAPA